MGSSAVAAVGAAGMYMWLANGLATLAKMGGQVKVAQALGAKENKQAVSYAKSALQLGIALGVIYGVLAVVLANPLIDFFKLNSADVVADAKSICRLLVGE